MNKKTYIKNLKILKRNLNAIIPFYKTPETGRDLMNQLMSAKKFYEKHLADNTEAGQTINMCISFYENMSQSINDLKSTTIKIVAAIVAYVGAKKLWQKIDLFGKYALNDTKKTIELTINAKDYSELTKYTKKLKDIQAKKWFRIASYNSTAVELSDEFLRNLKIGYITLGFALILTSIILCILIGVLTKPFTDIINAVKEKNFKLAVKGLIKLTALGLFALPAVLGIVLILVAVSNFDDKGTAAEIMNKLGSFNKMLTDTSLTIGSMAMELTHKAKEA